MLLTDMPRWFCALMTAFSAFHRCLKLSIATLWKQRRIYILLGSASLFCGTTFLDLFAILCVRAFIVQQFFCACSLISIWKRCLGCKETGLGLCLGEIAVCLRKYSVNYDFDISAVFKRLQTQNSLQLHNWFCTLYTKSLIQYFWYSVSSFYSTNLLHKHADWYNQIKKDRNFCKICKRLRKIENLNTCLGSTNNGMKMQLSKLDKTAALFGLLSASIISCKNGGIISF